MIEAPLKLLKTKEARGFTLIELLMIIIILGILSVISLPSLLKQVNKAQVAEAKDHLGAINRAQQAYFFEKLAFANSLNVLSIDFTVGSFQGGMYRTNFYKYSVTQPPTETEVHHLATPIANYTNELNAVASATFRVDDAFNSLICEADDVSVPPDIVDITTCNNGTFIK